VWNSLPDIVVKVSREDWTDYGMFRKLNLFGKLTVKVPEVEVIWYKF